MNYWGYRIDTSKINFFWDELREGRLRQGWGYNQEQDLRKPEGLDPNTRPNLRMLQDVKKGDILLIPRLPDWGRVAIAEATEDWDKGYKFEISEKYGDYGHIFPAKYLKNFVRGNKHVTGNIRSTLRNPRRFWQIFHVADIEELKKQEENELWKYQNHAERLKDAVNDVFEKEFKDKIYNKLNEQFTSESWEFVLVEGLQKLFPHYIIERVGGKKEKEHGTDILIKMPSLSEYHYGVAIQVKDWGETAGTYPIEQIKKADSYFEKYENLKLIDKFIIITKSSKESSQELQSKSIDEDIKVIFAEDLKEILSNIAKKLLGEDSTI